MTPAGLPPADVTAADVIAALALAPHPEGGHYRETYRAPTAAGDARSPVTLIYFLLAAGEVSHWHRVDAAEIWLWHAGAPLTLEILAPGEALRTVKLGGDVFAGDVPQGVVPKDAWQSARTCGAWTLVSCTVAPGFTFDEFELAPQGATPTSLSTENRHPNRTA